MELEIKAFEVYVRDRTQENRDSTSWPASGRKAVPPLLPFDYERIGEERYARTWNMKNGYEGHCTARDQLLEMDSASEDFIPVCTKFMICSLTFRPTPEDWQVTLKEGKTYQEKVRCSTSCRI